MRRLELEYDITNISALYEEGTVSWDKAEFTSGKDFTAHLKLWEDGIEPEQVWEELPKLEERGESFRIGLRYRGNRNIALKRKDYPTYYFGDRPYPLRSEKEFAVFTEYMRGKRESFGTFHLVMPALKLEMHITVPPTHLPKDMPTIPSDLHWLAETLVLADEQSAHPDQVMRLAYIVLDELDPAPSVDLRCVRNFVSHKHCDADVVIDLIEKNLPSAIITKKNSKGRNCVQFRRTDKEHMAFVAKHAYSAFQKAKELFAEKVKSEGGSLGD